MATLHRRVPGPFRNCRSSECVAGVRSVLLIADGPRLLRPERIALARKSRMSYQDFFYGLGLRRPDLPT